jgi:hypothetical protein
MLGFYEDIEMGYQAWNDRFQSQFIDFDSAHVQTTDYSLQSHVRSWMNLAKHVVLGAIYCFSRMAPKCRVLNSRRKITDRGCILKTDSDDFLVS